jgi:signal transduction histidine kinase
MNLLKDELKINKIQWKMNLNNDLPLVQADGILIQQALINIILNAIQAMSSMLESQDRWLNVETNYRDRDDIVVITVSDGGPGISEEMINQIFQPLFSTKGKGMGIGLALSRSLVEMHGGRIMVNRNRQQGTIFIINLPVSGHV